MQVLRKRRQSWGLRLSLVNMDIIVNARRLEFKCVEMYNLPIYKLRRVIDNFKYYVKKNKYSQNENPDSYTEIVK